MTPTCGPCRRRSTECTYASKSNRSRFSALELERDQLLAHHNDYMNLYDWLKYGSSSEVSVIIGRIRKTDGPLDLPRFEPAHGRPSQGIHSPHVTTLDSEHYGYQAIIHHLPEELPSPLAYHTQTTTQTEPTGIPIDPAFDARSFRSPYQPAFSAQQPASSHHGVLETANTGSDSPKQNREIFQAIPRQYHPEIDQSTARSQSTRRSPPAIPVAQFRTPSALLAPNAIYRSPLHSHISHAAATPIALQDLDAPEGHEDVIAEYVLWQTRRACTEEWRSQFARAGEILLERGFRLKLFYQTKPINMLLEGGVSKGIALSFHGDIPNWVSDFCHDSGRYHW